MTIHIGHANGKSAVLFSDSQGSTPRSEIHGWHKQFVGSNFAVGIAGAGNVIQRMFSYLSNLYGVEKDVLLDVVKTTIEDFISSEIRESSRSLVAVVLVAFDKSGCPQTLRFDPGVFSTFDTSIGYVTIGSGSEFINQAMSRHIKLGVNLPHSTLIDQLLSASYYADAANESLTVDDKLSVTILKDGKSYLLGERELDVVHVHDEVRINWIEISRKWREIHELLTTIHSEVRSAQRTFSKIRTGELGVKDLASLDVVNKSVVANRSILDNKVQEFIVYYDTLLNR